MSRPCKLRTVLKEPSTKAFEPVENYNGDVILKIDEYEVIRLIDHLKYDQEKAAKTLNVARTTVQAIYQSARDKIADSLINSKRLLIEGGDYKLNVNSAFNKESKTYESILKEKEYKNMRIALPVANGEIWQHFGKTETFIIYDVEGKEIKDKRLVDTNGQGHGALAEFLRANGVDTLICGGIGYGAINALTVANIEIIPGIEGDPEKAIQLYLEEKLEGQDPETCGCGHHNGEDHECCHHEDGEEHHCCHHEDGEEHHCCHHDK